MALLRQLDLLLLAIALPVFVLGDLPIAGYLAGGGAWLVQRLIRHVLTQRAVAATDARAKVGLMAGSMIARGWLVAIAIFVVGIAHSDAAGLSAALLVISLFTVYFTMTMILRPFDEAPDAPKANHGTGHTTANGPAA